MFYLVHDQPVKMERVVHLSHLVARSFEAFLVETTHIRVASRYLTLRWPLEMQVAALPTPIYDIVLRS